jgi:hypothetical protein
MLGEEKVTVLLGEGRENNSYYTKGDKTNGRNRNRIYHAD